MSLFEIQKMVDNLKSTPIDSGELIANIDGILSTNEISAKAIPFFSGKDIEQLLTSRVIGTRKAKLKWTHNDTQLYSIEYLYNQDGNEILLQGDFFLICHTINKCSFIAITLDNSIVFKRAMIPFLEGLYPCLSFTFLKHDKYKQLLCNTIIRGRFDKVSINRASVKFRFLDQEENRRKMSAVIWPSMNLEEAFNWVQENNSYFNSLSLKILLSHGHDYAVSYTRRGILTTNRQFSHFMDNLITPVCELMSKNRNLFGNRGRNETENASVRPLVLEFPFDYFAKKEDNHKFIDALKAFSDSSVSILHGNPYIHLSIVDYCDGSTYDLWVLSPKRLIIVPQLKSTIESIGRLLSHVFDTYAEGKIMDYQELYDGKYENV